MTWVAIVVAGVLLEYMTIVTLTGRARGRYGVQAPATTGHPIFERWFRVQQNTLEQLVIFLPGIGLFAHYASPSVAALLGLAFGVGRALYARGYVADPARRELGFALSSIANALLVLGGLAGALASLLRGA